jgi:hypothetical protein
MSLRRSCRQAAALLIAREDRALQMSDRVALKLHLMACQACPRFENQILTMRAAMGQWRNYSGDAEGEAGSHRPEKSIPPKV